MSSYDFETQDPQDSVRISGRIKWFDAGKGYGFIVPDDPQQTGLKDVLLHVTSLRNAGRESALEGSIIVCDVVRRSAASTAMTAASAGSVRAVSATAAASAARWSPAVRRSGRR